MAFGMFKRTLMGGAFGGLYGGMSNNGSAAGGAIGGAAMGGLGLWGARSLLGKRTIAGTLGVGGARLAGLARRGAGWSAQQGRLGLMGAGAGYSLAGGLLRGSRAMMNNAPMVNKWGGRALAGMGVASGAMIGSSVISSNNGF